MKALRVERKIGGWLQENESTKNVGGNPNLSTDTTGWKLKDFKLSRDASSKAQMLAKKITPKVLKESIY